MAYHYRLTVPTGYVEEVREQIEPADAVEAQVDGSQVAGTNDVTLLTVFSGKLESLTSIKRWVDTNPDGIDLTLVTMIGTPVSVRESELEALQTMVQSHQTLEVEAPERG